MHILEYSLVVVGVDCRVVICGKGSESSLADIAFSSASLERC